MLNSNLLELLGKFSSSEFKEFGEFVSSPFFNKNENVVGLYRCLKKYFPEFDNNKLKKEHVYSKLFGNEKYNDGYMRTLMFKLQKLAEEYLSYTNFRQKEHELRVSLLDELNNRKIEKLFLKNISDQQKEFEESEYKGYDYFHYKIELENQMQLYQNWSRYKAKDFKDYVGESFNDSIDLIISAFLIRVLKKYRFLLAKEFYEKLSVKFDFLDGIINLLSSDENKYRRNPVIDLHVNEILLMKTRDDRYYYILKDMLINGEGKLNQDERYSLHNIINQYAVQRHFEGAEHFKKERFELYKISLEKKIYKGKADQFFDDIFFSSIVMCGIQAGEFEWTESFIDKYQDELARTNRNTIMNFCLAKISFAKKDYAMSLRHLSKINTIRAIQFKTAIRDLTLMTYYEMNMFSQAYFLSDSYRHFLTKNRPYYSDSRFDRMTNFLRFFLKVTKIKENPDKPNLDELDFELSRTSNVMEREWLTEKVNELKRC